MIERGAGATYSIIRAGAAWTSVGVGVTASVGVTMVIGGSRKFAMPVVTGADATNSIMGAGAVAAQVAASTSSSVCVQAWAIDLS